MCHLIELAHYGISSKLPKVFCERHLLCGTQTRLLCSIVVVRLTLCNVVLAVMCCGNYALLLQCCCCDMLLLWECTIANTAFVSVICCGELQ